MPCRHICAIIEDKEFHVPSMFYILWHKLSNYYHSDSFEMKLATHSTATTSNNASWNKDNCFLKSDSYKGVYIKDSLYFNQLPSFTSLKSDHSNICPI